MSNNALKSAVLLYSLICRFPFLKDNEEEKKKIKEKIKIAKEQFKENLKEYNDAYIELLNDSSKWLWDGKQQCSKNKEYLANLLTNEWFYDSLRKIVKYTTIIDDFLNINKLRTIDEVDSFMAKGERHLW